MASAALRWAVGAPSVFPFQQRYDEVGGTDDFKNRIDEPEVYGVDDKQEEYPKENASWDGVSNWVVEKFCRDVNMGGG